MNIIIIGLIIGICFGFILESSGLASTKNLVGLFYGYDSRVLKVFFTAAITSMIGILFLSRFGIIEQANISINATFLWSAIIGGALIGAGFIVGGYCPGTSFASSATGKIDAMIFLVGMGVGTIAWERMFPYVKSIYYAEAWGRVSIYKMLNIKATSFVIILAIIASGMFFVSELIEKYLFKKNLSHYPRIITSLILCSLSIILYIIS